MSDQLPIILNSLLSENKEERDDAQKKLNQFKKQKGSLIKLLQYAVIGGNENLNLQTQAAIALKNIIQSKWEDLNPNLGKAELKDSIIQAIIITPKVIQKQLLLVLEDIVENEYPKRWKTLKDELLGILNKEDINVKYGSLLVINTVVRCLGVKKGKQFKAFEDLLSNLVPALLQTALIIHQSNQMDERYAQILKEICKIFYLSAYHQLPAILKNINDLKNLIELMLSIVVKEIPDNIYV
ncbi:MAG: hypothetical protein EZS28_015731 [Streblomastix strix]|uniref:Importin N-terminal domain-containing protein n=1 Tax=Streblomastix strix TaxID=222440 RepID=A0A5J4W1C1_9EUKA|nr:MAG: hypothetical protein EZS28_015731 [Streblomastix strix]